jgi:riboflavin synthase
MFTGLVEERAIALDIEKSDSRKNGPSLRLTAKAHVVAQVVKKGRNSLSFEAGSETLSRTNLSRLKAGDQLNLERSLALGDRLGGHLVTGHIDGVATVIKRRDEGDWSHVTFKAPQRMMRQMAEKGSVAVDGVSLTLVSVAADRFSVALIPHTLENTTLGGFEVGSIANIETDLLAKYVERMLQERLPPVGRAGLGSLPALKRG